MRYTPFVVCLLVVLMAVALLAHPATARAQQPEPTVHLGFEAAAVTGDEIAVSAYLTDPAGRPVSDAEISFTVEAEFMNVSSAVELGRTVTDDNGLALILFEPRSEGPNSLTATFAGNSVFAPASDTGTLTVLGGGQIYRELPPFRIPGANVWLATALLSLVWLVFMVSLGLIAWGNYRARRTGWGSDA